LISLKKKINNNEMICIDDFDNNDYEEESESETEDEDCE
jgi:hypothetical protein